MVRALPYLTDAPARRGPTVHCGWRWARMALCRLSPEGAGGRRCGGAPGPAQPWSRGLSGMEDGNSRLRRAALLRGLGRGSRSSAPSWSGFGFGLRRRETDQEALRPESEACQQLADTGGRTAPRGDVRGPVTPGPPALRAEDSRVRG